MPSLSPELEELHRLLSVAVKRWAELIEDANEEDGVILTINQSACSAVATSLAIGALSDDEFADYRKRKAKEGWT